MKHLWNHSLRVYHMNGSLCGCAHRCKSNKVKIVEDWGLFKASQDTANTNSTRMSLNPQRLNIFYACKLQVGYPLATFLKYIHIIHPNETTAWSLTSYRKIMENHNQYLQPNSGWSLHQTPDGGSSGIMPRFGASCGVRRPLPAFACHDSRAEWVLLVFFVGGR